MNKMAILKVLTRGGGVISVFAGVVTLLLKSLGMDVEETAVLPLITAGIAAFQGGSYIKVIEAAEPVMSSLHNKTIDALYHLMHVLPKDKDGKIEKALADLWSAAREIAVPDAQGAK